MLGGRQKYGDEVKADTILRDVMRGASVLATANPLPTRFRSFPTTAPRPPILLYIYIITCELYILLCFLAFLIIEGRSDCPLGT